MALEGPSEPSRISTSHADDPPSTTRRVNFDIQSVDGSSNLQIRRPHTVQFAIQSSGPTPLQRSVEYRQDIVSSIFMWLTVSAKSASQLSLNNGSTCRRLSTLPTTVQED